MMLMLAAVVFCGCGKKEEQPETPEAETEVVEEEAEEEENLLEENSHELQWQSALVSKDPRPLSRSGRWDRKASSKSSPGPQQKYPLHSPVLWCEFQAEEGSRRWD